MNETECSSALHTAKTVNRTMNLAEKEKGSDSQPEREAKASKGNHKPNVKRSPALCAVTDPQPIS